MVEPTDRAALTLRRHGDNNCPRNGGHYHNAEVTVSTDMPWPPPAELSHHGRGDGYYKDVTGTSVDIDRSDKRWPTHCACGFKFLPGHGYQPNYDRLFRGIRNGVEVLGVHGNTGPILPPGAMWFVDPADEHWKFYCEGGGRPGPDGKYLAVRLPQGTVFIMDGPAWDRSGKRPCPWSRTGTAPDVVLSPSINIVGSYHGWLGQGGAAPGWLTDDIEGRRYDDLGR